MRRVLTALLLVLAVAAAPLLLVLAVAAAPLLLSVPAAVAQDPVELGSGHVVDQAGVLSDADVDTVEAATAALKKNHQITLYVVFVDHFTNPADAEDWANETAARNDLAPTDYLLDIETTGENLYLSGDDSGPVNDRELTTIEQQQVAPKVHTQDWTQAALAAAHGLGNAVDGGPGPAFVWLLVIGLVAVVFVLLVRRQRSSRSRRSMTP
ncbi:TPM domain-containing protein [Leifsonia sp. McL0607]|uniref:TPM domain-containing protein n=1 Tax=Leifsonia sp. McL0607 TaxID=3415672 RepID=UPI003CEC7A28